jgi:peptide/nickel transport system permease protein
MEIVEETLERHFIRREKKVCKVSFFVPGYEYAFLNLLPSSLHLLGSPNCSQDFHLLGTDKLGRDFFTRLLHGLRPSLLVGIIGASISFPLGIMYGSIAGYRGGAVGELMMRFVEVVLSLPSLYLLVILAAILPEIVPQLSSYLIIALTLGMPSYILGETTLSFLGLGINQPDASLGNLLSEGRSLSNLLLRPWLASAPSLILIVLVWSFHSIGDQLRDIFDPKSQGATS